MGGKITETIREWLSKSPDDFGFKRKRWQLQMVQEMLVRTGIAPSDHAVRGAMRRARFSFRKSRPAPRKSASEEEQKEFKKETAAQILGPAIPGYVIVALDEAACMIGGWNGYSRLPRGGHETFRIIHSRKSVKHTGALGDGWFHIATVDSVNSTTLQSFIDGPIEKVGSVAAMLDNAACHHSKSTDTYEEESGGKLRRIFLPAYTPQLNPIKTLWREIKRTLAGEYFDTIDELKAAIMDIVNNGELIPPKLQEYMMPDGVGQPQKPISCTITDMTGDGCRTEAAAA